MTTTEWLPAARGRVSEHRAALQWVDEQLPVVLALGSELSRRLTDGAKLLVAGNGGSAAEAQHLTAELVGRFEDEDRPPLAAVALHADTSSFSAIVNDFGAEQAFSRQMRAHARAGDLFLALSTSGSSRNVLAAAETARALDVSVWALTGRSPNPLAAMADASLAVPSDEVSAVQEIHLVLIHLLCGALEHDHAQQRAMRQRQLR